MFAQSLTILLQNTTCPTFNLHIAYHLASARSSARDTYHRRDICIAWHTIVENTERWDSSSSRSSWSWWHGYPTSGVPVFNYSSFGKAWQWRVSPWPTNFRIWQLLMCQQTSARVVSPAILYLPHKYIYVAIDMSFWSDSTYFWRKNGGKGPENGWDIRLVAPQKAGCNVVSAEQEPSRIFSKNRHFESCYSLSKPRELSERICGSLAIYGNSWATATRVTVKLFRNCSTTMMTATTIKRSLYPYQVWCHRKVRMPPWHELCEEVPVPVARSPNSHRRPYISPLLVSASVVFSPPCTFLLIY